MCTCSGLCRGTKGLFFLLLGNPFGERQRVHTPFFVPGPRTEGGLCFLSILSRRMRVCMDNERTRHSCRQRTFLLGRLCCRRGKGRSILADLTSSCCSSSRACEERVKNR